MTRMVVAEYVNQGDAFLLFIMRSDMAQPQLVRVPVSAALVAQAAELFHPAQVAYLSLEDIPPQCHALVEPLAEYCDLGDLLYLIPSAPLNRLPLHCLPLDGMLLWDRNPICYALSASLLARDLRRAASRRTSAIVFGDPQNDLPHARDEAVLIANQLGTTAHIGTAATRSALRQALERDEGLGIMHLACHGYFDAAVPARSGLVLARSVDEGRDDSDDVLTAEDILDWTLQADLVTVSACESGLVNVELGEEPIGLTRALLLRGAASVLLCSWPIDDLSTRFLMQHFYEGYQAGKSKAIALQAAQRFVRGLTATSALTACEERLGAVSRDDFELGLWLELSQAALYTKAGDLQRASDVYDKVLRRLEQFETIRHDRLAGAVRLRRDLVTKKAEVHSKIDYDVTVFSDPYYFAPFFIIGDAR